MSAYRFSVIVVAAPQADDEILNVADALGDAGCSDASIRGHSSGIELLFERSSDSLQLAIESAIADIEKAGYRVARVEMEREAIAS